MSENAIDITKLNDFIFCPVSIYFHEIDNDSDRTLSQETFQINGTAAHKTIDNKKYSSKKCVLQSTKVYSEKYNLIGKIDIFDFETGILTERKKKIKVIYEGYIFQLYAQYFCLKEMGYVVNKIRLYSMDDNKVYDVKIPEEDEEMFQKFENIIYKIETFNFKNFTQDNIEKCKRCIYRQLCYFTEYEDYR